MSVFQPRPSIDHTTLACASGELLITPTGAEYAILKEYHGIGRTVLAFTGLDSPITVWKTSFPHSDSRKHVAQDSLALAKLHAAGIEGIMPLLSIESDVHDIFMQFPYLGRPLVEHEPSIALAARIAPSLTRTIAQIEDCDWYVRDIKPDNMYVCADQCIVGDFGTAHEGALKGTAKRFYGTPQYLSAVQMTGQHDTGMFSVGASLFKIATGNFIAPLGDTSRQSFVLHYKRLLKKDFEPWNLPQSQMDTYAPFMELVERMLEPNPLDRPDYYDAVDQFSSFAATLPSPSHAR